MGSSYRASWFKSLFHFALAMPKSETEHKSKGYDVHMKNAYDRLTAPVAPGTP